MPTIPTMSQAGGGIQNTAQCSTGSNVPESLLPGSLLAAGNLAHELSALTELPEVDTSSIASLRSERDRAQFSLRFGVPTLLQLVDPDNETQDINGLITNWASDERFSCLPSAAAIYVIQADELLRSSESELEKCTREARNARARETFVNDAIDLLTSRKGIEGKPY